MLQNSEAIQNHEEVIQNNTLSEDEEDKEFDRLLTAITSILNIKDSWFRFILVDTSNGNKLDDDFAMPSGMGIGGGKKYIIAIDGELWTKYIEETNPKMKIKRCAAFVRVISHEFMHLYQFKHSFDKYAKEFYYEKSLPHDQDNWNYRQHKKYINLSIELEAYAFGLLVESKILNRKRITYIPYDINKYQFRKTYLQIKSIYEKKIEEAFNLNKEETDTKVVRE
ncbi:MAG: hypothetical protein MJ207_02250 [Bacilli bacterium]|nr:hypothetical protein [Bacilli bacterium]